MQTPRENGKDNERAVNTLDPEMPRVRRISTGGQCAAARVGEAESHVGPAVLDHCVHVAGRLQPRHVCAEEADTLVPARHAIISYDTHHRWVTHRRYQPNPLAHGIVAQLGKE